MSVMSANSVMSARKTYAAAVTSQATAEWIKLFPREVTQTYTSSVAFMKQLSVIAVSTITYLKEICPEESYVTESFGGVRLRILKAKCEDDTAHFISTSLIQSFEALEKKYLGKLVLCLYDGPCHVDNLVEAHSLEFTYLPTGVSMDMWSAGRDSGATQAEKYTFENIRESTLNLFKACVVVSQQSRRENEEPYDISLRLYYNNEAPVGYQAPGFSPASAEEAAEARDPLASALAQAATLGRVETPFHHLMVRSHIREIASSHEANASPNVPMMTQNESADDDVCSGQEGVPLHTTGASAAPAPAVRCTCGSRAAAGDDAPLITCDYCGTLQHAACYGVGRGPAAAPAPHCCTRCSDLEPARAPSCARLAALPHNQRQLLCLFRRSLAWAARAAPVTARALAARLHTGDKVARKLLKHLHSNGVLRGTGDDFDSPQIIDREQLSIVTAKFMQPDQNTVQPDQNTVVERLVAESLTRQGALDPVGRTPGPYNTTGGLQHATTMGKIIQHTPPDDAVEDSTLKQYRQAIFSTDKHTDEELPLSGGHNPVKHIGSREKTVTKRKMDDPDNKHLHPRLRNKKSKAM